MQYLKVIFSGLITTTASFNPSLWPLSLYGLVLLHQEIRARTNLYSLGLIWGVSFYSMSYYWIINPIHNMAHLPYSLSFLFTILAIIYFAQLPALTLFLVQKTDKKLLTIMVIWGALEYLVSNFSIAFPWSLIGYLMVNSPWAYLAPIGGVYLISMVTILISGLLANPINTKEMLFVFFICMLNFISFNPNTSIGKLNVSWDEKFYQNAETSQLSLMIEKLSNEKSPKNIDLRVWPEGAIKWILEKKPIEIRNIPTLSGIFHQKNGKVYNSAALFDKGKTTIVSKNYLVPFGEYTPLYRLLQPLLGTLNIPMSNLSSDNNLNILKFKNFNLATLICYEIAFPTWSWKNLKHSNALILITDDHWFKSKVAIQEHLNIFKMRLIESQQSGLFVNDSGFSQVINLHPGKGLTMTDHKTLIVEYGNYLILLIFILLILVRSIIAKYYN